MDCLAAVRDFTEQACAVKKHKFKRTGQELPESDLDCHNSLNDIGGSYRSLLGSPDNQDQFVALYWISTYCFRDTQ